MTDFRYCGKDFWKAEKSTPVCGEISAIESKKSRARFETGPKKRSKQ